MHRPEFAFQLPGEVPGAAHDSVYGTMADQGAAAVRCEGTSGLRVPGPLSALVRGLSHGRHWRRAPHLYLRLGGWAHGSSVVDRCYIDPTFMPSPAAYALYGWALSRQYSAGAAEVVRATCLPDPRVMQPAACAAAHPSGRDASSRPPCAPTRESVWVIEMGVSALHRRPRPQRGERCSAL